MKFKFTTTPLKDLPLGSVVDGYCLTQRSHTGKNAIGYRCTGKIVGGFHEPAEPHEAVLLVYSDQPAVQEVTA